MLRPYNIIIKPQSGIEQREQQACLVPALQSLTRRNQIHG